MVVFNEDRVHNASAYCTVPFYRHNHQHKHRHPVTLGENKILSIIFPVLLDLDIAPARPRVPFTLPEEETTLTAANTEQEETNPLLTEEESLARLLRKIKC